MIRRATEDDARALLLIARAAFAVYLPRMTRRPGPMDLDIAAHIANDHVWLCETEYRSIAGFAVLVLDQQSALLDTMAVLPERQGHGLGRKLIAHVENWLIAQGRHEIRLFTNVAMHESRAWYPRLGYRETGIVHELGFERVYFVKNLMPSGAPTC